MSIKDDINNNVKIEENVVNNNFVDNNSEDLSNNSLSNNTECNNSCSVQNEDENDNKEKQPEKITINRNMMDEDFINFEKDLKDYLRRTISDKRQQKFFKNVLPESLGIVQNLFIKNNNVSTDIVIPLYRNNFLELSLAIEHNGKIKKKLSILKP